MSNENSSATNPSHYKQGSIETRFIIEHCTIGLRGIQAVYVGNIIKYLHRAPFKNGVEDIEKAITYLKFLGDTFKEGERAVDPREVARHDGGKGLIWVKIYEMYEGEEAVFGRLFVEELTRMLMRVGTKEDELVNCEACLINIKDSMEMKSYGKS